jgi:hypothetical protein
MQNSTYNPANINNFEKTKLSYSAVGISGSAVAGATTNFDYEVMNDILITGAQVLANIPTFGDSMSFQVVDVNNILGLGADVILNQFVTNWQLRSDSQEQIDLKINYPAKIIAGLYLRMIYKSTGTTVVNIAANYSLHEILI